MTSKKKQAKQFNYAVGHYWEGESGSVGCYAYGNEHFYGTMEQAKSFLKYVQDQDAKEKKADRRDWRIFQLIEVPQ
jgi:hypothetical protein